MPVPLNMEIEFIGSTWTYSCGESGAFTLAPMSSWPWMVARLFGVLKGVTENS